MNPISILPDKVSFVIKTQPGILTKPSLKKNKNWYNATLEEYSDFIFAHGRNNTLENLDAKIRDSLLIPDPIKDNSSESPLPPFEQGTHPGTLLVGLLLEIYRSTYHYGVTLEDLLERATHIPSIMEDSSTTQRKGIARWFLPTLEDINQNYRKRDIQQLYIKIPRRLCSLGINLISRLAGAEAHSKLTGAEAHLESANFQLKDICALKAHRGFYQLSLLWAITGAYLKELTDQYDLEIHPFFKMNSHPLPKPTIPSPIQRIEGTYGKAY